MIKTPEYNNYQVKPNTLFHIVYHLLFFLRINDKNKYVLTTVMSETEGFNIEHKDKVWADRLPRLKKIKICC